MIMKKVSLLKPLLLLFALIVGSSSAWADDVSVTLTSAQIKAGTGSSSYGACSATDGNGNTWNAYAIKYQHSAATSDYNFWQIKKYASSTAYYVQVPTLGTKIKSITITVSSTSKPRGDGGNTATLYFSSSNSTSASGTGVASGTGASSITIDCSDLDLNAGYITASGAVRIWDVTVTYSASIVNVTGVSLNKTSLSIPVGESETLTATVAPAGATNKNVTWSSNKESVATVVDGVVTGVSEGTATITVTTEDGGKTATCDVTVTAAPTAVVTLDFTSNTWGFPEGTKTVTSTDYSNGKYTITLEGSTGNGYYYDTDANNLLIGKKDATLTLPAFAFNVKRIKVYGADGAAAGVTFNVFVGDDAVSTQVTSSKVTQTFDIAADKQAEGTVYVIKVTNPNNMRISKIEVFGTKKVTIASSGYSTLASAYGLDFANATPAGLEAYVASSVTASGVDLSAVTEAPASTGVILKGTAGTEYTIPFKASAAAVGTNKLHAAVTAYDCAANEVYILKDGLFHLVTGASTVPAGKAYLLASDVPSGARELTFNFGDETAIRSLTPTLSEGEGVWYDLSGRRVENPTKGIYIMNGKKVIFK